MTLDIGQDCTAFDGDETLTLLPVADGGKGYDNGIQIADCLGRSPQYRDLQFLGTCPLEVQFASGICRLRIAVQWSRS